MGRPGGSDCYRRDRHFLSDRSSNSNSATSQTLCRVLKKVKECEERSCDLFQATVCKKFSQAVYLNLWCYIYWIYWCSYQIKEKRLKELGSAADDTELFHASCMLCCKSYSMC